MSKKLNAVKRCKKPTQAETKRTQVNQHKNKRNLFIS